MVRDLEHFVLKPVTHKELYLDNPVNCRANTCTKDPIGLSERVALVNIYLAQCKSGCLQPASPMGPWRGRVPEVGGTGPVRTEGIKPGRKAFYLKPTAMKALAESLGVIQGAGNSGWRFQGGREGTRGVRVQNRFGVKGLAPFSFSCSHSHFPLATALSPLQLSHRFMGASPHCKARQGLWLWMTCDPAWA